MPKLALRNRPCHVRFRDVNASNHPLDDSDSSSKHCRSQRKVSFDGHHSSSEASLDISSSFLNSEYAVTPLPQMSDTHDSYQHQANLFQDNAKRHSLCRQSRSSCLMSLDNQRKIATVSEDDLTSSISEDSSPVNLSSLTNHDLDQTFQWGHFIDLSESPSFKPLKTSFHDHFNSVRFMPYRMPEVKPQRSDDLLDISLKSISLRD